MRNVNSRLFDLVSEQMSYGMDLIKKQIPIGQNVISIVFIHTLTELSKVQHELIYPVSLFEDVEQYLNHMNQSVSFSGIKEKEIIPSLIAGYTLIEINGSFFYYEARKALNTNVQDSKVETVILGPQNSFSENVDVNMNIIRSRYPNTNLLVNMLEVGKESKTKTVVVYNEKLADAAVVNEVIHKIKSIDAEMVQSLNQLEVLMQGKFTLFPTVLITERPDRVALNLAQGKIVILMEGVPFALVTPAVFFDFMTAMDDMYNSAIISRALIVLRYIALLVSLTLPAIYISVVSYNPEIFRVQLAFSIAGSRAGVPYPSFIEVLFMLFLIEALIEASIRLPQTIGSTATTVGGLILGQAAQQAGLVSSIMIIITSAVAISTFVIPINSMTLAVRLIKYFLIALATFYGIFGVAIGMFMLIMHLANMRSFGKPYLKLFFGEKKKMGGGSS